MMEFRPKEIPFQGTVMNAAGCRCTTWKELSEIDKSSSAATVTKSCTVKYRDGNPSPRYYEFADGSINSNGLHNHGLAYYLNYGNLRRWNKPYIISIAGDIDEVKNMLELSIGNTPEYTFFEVNLTCPNIGGREISSFKMDLDRLMSFCKSESMKIGIKMPVIFDLNEIRDISAILNNYRRYIYYISCSNSLPNGLILGTDYDPVIVGGKNGLGGIGGAYLKPFSLMNVREFSRSLRGIKIIGCGGISTQKDVRDYIQCGATAVQIGTHFMKKGTECFTELSF